MLANHLGVDIPVDQRARFLTDNCDRVEQLSYLKVYTADEIDDFKNQLSDVSVEIDQLEEDKKAAVKEFNDSINPKKKQRSTILTSIRTKSREVTEQTFAFFNHESGQVGYYNAQGQLVSFRKMKPQERQGTVFNIIRDPSEPNRRTGTEG